MNSDYAIDTLSKRKKKGAVESCFWKMMLRKISESCSRDMQYCANINFVSYVIFKIFRNMQSKK